MSTGRIPLWVDLREVPVNKRLPYWKAVKAAKVEKVLLGTDDPHLERDGVDTIRLDGNNALKQGTKPIGRYVHLRGAKDQDRAAEVDGIVIVEGTDWTIIPLENLIAARRDRPGTLFGLARDPDTARLFRETLEIGVHGIVLAPSAPADVQTTHDILTKAGPRRDDQVAARSKPADPEDRDGEAAPRAAGTDEAADASAPKTVEAPGDFLVPATVTALEEGGSGDRVCIDTTSIFRDGEGLLIGSTARAFALIHAETIESEYVRARPFRVNAGAVHSYLYAPDGKTRYLSEMRSGMKVLAVHPDGVHRVVTVGRAKIEQRPHTLIRWETQAGREGHAVLQTAETIRLVAPDGTPVSITDLKTGDKILVHTEDAARHFGMPVEEKLEEI